MTAARNSDPGDECKCEKCECPRCGGSGFERPGTGYDAVCSYCGGLKLVIKKLDNKKKWCKCGALIIEGQNECFSCYMSNSW